MVSKTAENFQKLPRKAKIKESHKQDKAFREQRRNRHN
jgi:hypothetical protein